MRIAAIDVGSNSIHMVIAQVESDGRFRVLDRAKEMVRLGTAIGQRPALGRGHEAGLRTLRGVPHARRDGKASTASRRSPPAPCARPPTAATSFDSSGAGGPARQGHPRPRGSAIWYYLGARYADRPARRSDADSRRRRRQRRGDSRPRTRSPSAAQSQDRRRPAEREVFVDESAPGAQDMARLEHHIADQLAPISGEVVKRRCPASIGTSGTLLNLISIAAYLARRTSRRAHRTTTGQRPRRSPGPAHARQDRIVAARSASRVSTPSASTPSSSARRMANYILRRLDAKEMVACTWSLREGVLLDFISRHRKGIEETERFADMRHRSVARFVAPSRRARRARRQVSDLALQLFDQLRDGFAGSAAGGARVARLRFAPSRRRSSHQSQRTTSGTATTSSPTASSSASARGSWRSSPRWLATIERRPRRIRTRSSACCPRRTRRRCAR